MSALSWNPASHVATTRWSAKRTGSAPEPRSQAHWRCLRAAAQLSQYATRGAASTARTPRASLGQATPRPILENNPMHSSGMIDVSAWPAARPAGDTQCPDVFRTSTCKGRRCHAERQKPPRLSRVRPSRMRRRQLRPIRFGSNCNWSIPSRRPSRHRQRDQERGRGRSPASRQGRLRQPYQQQRRMKRRMKPTRTTNDPLHVTITAGPARTSLGSRSSSQGQCSSERRVHRTRLHYRHLD